MVLVNSGANPVAFKGDHSANKIFVLNTRK